MADIGFFDACRHRIIQAEESGTKLATFHLLVLQNAQMLEGRNASEFCEAVGVPQGYAAEFQQMLALSRLMHRQGVWLLQA